jgi:hypothetical protein
MPVEVGCKVTMSVKLESGIVEGKTIPVKDFKTPHEPGTPAFWDDLLGFVRKYHIYPDTKQKTLATGSDAAKGAAEATNNSLGQKLKDEKKAAKGKGKEKPVDPDNAGTPPDQV